MEMKIMNTLIFTLTLVIFILPLLTLLGLLCYMLWYTLNSNSGAQFSISWQGKPLIAWELQNTVPDWKDMQKQSNNSLDNTSW